MSDFYGTGLVEAEFEFKIKIAMRARYKELDEISEDDSEEYDDLDPVHFVTPAMMMDNVVPKVVEAVESDNEDKLVQHLEEYFTFRLFQLLGLKHLPPTIEGGKASELDFETPEFVEVLSIKELDFFG